jgi:methylmalonyl-CoA mutase N-terminal domain/subunit
VQPVHGPDDLAPGLAGRVGEPGEWPYTRGIHPGMYTQRPWTIRQYAGYGTAAESNARYRSLVAAGTQGLSVAFDLPTQLGLDSDDPSALGEVGRVGVAIDSLADMRELFAGIDLGVVSTSMTINAPAVVLLLLYELVAEEQGVPADRLSGTVQNDVLKEYIARGTYIYPPGPSMRLVAETLAYCHRRLPRWNGISVSGYHMAEAGATPAQEVAFTLANAVAYVEAARGAGLAADDVCPRLSFFFVARTTLLEEVAKFRAARRVWARIARDRLGARDPRSARLRFHTQTAGVQLTAQQPEVNLVRVTVQALAAVLGGTQSLHTNAFDEALALPTERSARLALRTQQVLAHETDVTATVDPFGGSWAVERLTDDLDDEITALVSAIDDLGGAVAAVAAGYQQREIEEAAYAHERRVESGETVVVGVNRYCEDGREGGDGAPYRAVGVDPALEAAQRDRVAAWRAARDSAAVRTAVDRVREAAAGPGPVVDRLRDALAGGATVGEVCGALRDAWGVHRG